MNETRGIVTITEELTDLRHYLSGLPKQLVDTGAFGAYQKRESLLQEELIAAQIYRIVGQPTSPAAEPFSGLRGTMADVQKRMFEFQEAIRRRIRVRVFAKWAIAAMIVLTGVQEYRSDDYLRFVLLLNGTVGFLVYLFHCERLLAAAHQRLSRDIESLRCDLEAYAHVEDIENQSARTQREVLLSRVRSLANNDTGRRNVI